MIEFSFDENVLRFIIENRNDCISSVLRFFTYLGEDEGYILIIAYIFISHDKKLAFRLAILVLSIMSLNHILKMFIGNPRPFVREGTFVKKWLVSPEYASELAKEFSTPSGHAMSSFAFYGYLYNFFRNSYFRIIAVSTILLIGISRPYLAVHFVEDILLGWLGALIIVLLTLKYSSQISNLWKNINVLNQMFLAISLSLILWIITFYINEKNITSQPLPFVGHLGFILGVILGFYLEQKHLNFNPKSRNNGVKIIRWLLTVVLVMVPIIILEEIVITEVQPTYSNHLFQYFGYALSGFLGIFIAPLICIKINLVDRL